MHQVPGISLSPRRRKARKKDTDDQGIPYCPKCLSTSLSANKKGDSIAKDL